MSLVEGVGKVTHIPTVARQVFDVTGAGDTVVAALALALSAGASMRQAAILANQAAGIVVGMVGTGTVTAAQLDEALLHG
jgi:D-beta-D-heptose 7-phosphate kinase/D-beta-D-heptose 1-phosphate adenosyltransferase